MQKITKKIGNLKLVVHENALLAVGSFAKDISDILRELQKNGRRDVLFLSSGGSALAALENIDERVISPNLTIGVLDERFDPTNKISNYIELRKTAFYKRAVARGCRLIDTSTKKGQTQEGLAQFYEGELRNWRNAHPKGAIVVTMGLGPDGHTAGIMPFPENAKRFRELFEGTQFVASYDAGKKNQYSKRITVTMTFLRQVDVVSAFITGENKGPVFQKLIEGDAFEEVPGRILRSLPCGTVHVDSELIRSAGYLLSNGRL